MHRIGELFDRISSMDNLEIADQMARKGKHSPGIIEHDKKKKENLEKLQKDLLEGKYHTSKYEHFWFFEPKKRLIAKLPYYPDRITHWAIMLVMEPIWVNLFISDTYACIKGRGIHKCAKAVKEALKNDVQGTQYCLKLDIKKFYQSIEHNILKKILRKKLKDVKLLELLDEIIDSHEGVPIGNYLSQFFANLYLTYFDHWIKEDLKVRYYFRYADDIVFLGSDKASLKQLFVQINQYITEKLHLKIKDNWQIFPVDKRKIDFVGYTFNHKGTRLRKTIKLRFEYVLDAYLNNEIDKDKFLRTCSAYYGWFKHCDSKNFLKKLRAKTGFTLSNWDGKPLYVRKFLKGGYKVWKTFRHKKYFEIHCTKNQKSYTVKSSSSLLYYKLTGKIYNFNKKKTMEEKQIKLAFQPGTADVKIYSPAKKEPELVYIYKAIIEVTEAGIANKYHIFFKNGRGEYDDTCDNRIVPEKWLVDHTKKDYGNTVQKNSN